MYVHPSMDAEHGGVSRNNRRQGGRALVSAGALEQNLMFCVCWTYRHALFAADSRRRHAGPASKKPIVAWQRLSSQSKLGSLARALKEWDTCSRKDSYCC